MPKSQPIAKTATAAPARRCFCISFYEGSLDLLKYADDDFFIYFKGEENRAAHEAFADERKAWIPNTGYNLHAYLDFIIRNYEDLPDIVVFCKNSTYPRHVSEAVFARLSQRNVYTPIVDPESWEGMRFPVAVRSSAGDFLEINDSWYARGRRGRYFDDFDSFFSFIFAGAACPTYLRFGPGGNAVVPRSNILLRSRAFYQNLLSFIDNEPLALESFFIERSFDAIFCAPFEESAEMRQVLDSEALAQLAARPRHPVPGHRPWRRVLTKIHYAAARLGNAAFGTPRG
ncbi:DUF3431 domain-containing protein [Acidimangrovimonas pyrenivorans]|uniref:DUF3431 domain-containing protein n=1 Tax=Acidimangrovimonas pyrenivorans TaxID=2030798 RepID=A0ABV7AMJ4_9RHOB